MGTPLSLEAVKLLVTRLFDQKDRWERSALAEEIARLHAANGGKTSANAVISPLKRVLRDLRARGLLVSIGKGLWTRVQAWTKTGEPFREPLGIPLQAQYALGKVLELFNEKPTWNRKELVDRVVADHLAAGHVTGSQQPLVVVKNVLGRLRKRGLVENVGKGFWTKSSTSILESNRNPGPCGGIPLQPVFARKKILQMFALRSEWKRNEIVEKLAEDHLAEGNVLGSQDPTMVVKKALSYLQDAGSVESDGKGNWRVIDAPLQESVVPRVESIAQASKIGRRLDVETGLSTTKGPPDWVELGNGSEFVYLYYFDNDKEVSRLQGKITWACKIGYTTDDVVRRVMTQTKTARAYKPQIAVVIRSDNALYLEATIHNAFKMIDRHFGERDSIGHEWFDTSPDELIWWYSRFEQIMFKLKTVNTQ